MANSEASASRSKNMKSIMRTNLKTLVDAGVTIATGTDAGNIGTLHASSYLAELRAMQASGMTNWQMNWKLVCAVMTGRQIFFHIRAMAIPFLNH